MLVGVVVCCGGCAATASPMIEQSIVNSPATSAGLTIYIQTHTPFATSDGPAFGLRIDHFVQASPYVDYDRSRYLFEFGYSQIPRGYRRSIGWELMAMVGAARGAMGASEPTRIAFAGGAAFALPIRLGDAAFGDNALLRPTFLLVPFLNATFAYPVAEQFQPQIGGGIGFRIHLDSTLFP